MRVIKLFWAAVVFFTFAAYGKFPEKELNIDLEKYNITGHLQGVAYNGGKLYLSYTHHLIKYSAADNELTVVPVPMFDGTDRKDAEGAAIRKKLNFTRHHAGDPCWADGKLYVAYSGSGFNKELNGRYSYNYVLVFDENLKFLERFHVPVMQYGLGGMSYADGKFYLVGGHPKGIPGNTVYEFDRNFKLLKEYALAFNSNLGIQTISFDGTFFWIGCYGIDKVSYKCSRNFELAGVYDFDISTGVIHCQNAKHWCFREVRAKNKKLLRVVPLPITTDDAAVKIINCTVSADGAISCQGKNMDICALGKFLNSFKKKRVMLFIKLNGSVPGRAAASIILLAQHRKLPFQVLP